MARLSAFPLLELYGVGYRKGRCRLRGVVVLGCSGLSLASSVVRYAQGSVLIVTHLRECTHATPAGRGNRFRRRAIALTRRIMRPSDHNLHSRQNKISWVQPLWLPCLPLSVDTQLVRIPKKPTLESSERPHSSAAECPSLGLVAGSRLRAISGSDWSGQRTL